MMPCPFEQLISHLDGIAVILCLEKRAAFDSLRPHTSGWLPNEKNQYFESYELYRRQVVESTFVLGYGYFESYPFTEKYSVL